MYNLYTENYTEGGIFGYIGENGIVKALNVSQSSFEGESIAYKNEGWILEIYNSFFKKHIKTENLEKLDFLSVAFRSFKQTSVAVNG